MKEQPHLDVLVVDDESLIRWAVSQTLKLDGHHVTEASDAASAEAIVRDRVPNVAVVDYRLPGTTGFGLVRELRKLAPEMAIVLMTADPLPDLSEMTTVDVDDLLRKPFEMKAVTHAVRAAHAAHGVAATSRPAKACLDERPDGWSSGS